MTTHAAQLTSLTALTANDIDPRIYALYDEYCHGRMDRREFLSRASALAIVGGLGLAMAQALLPRIASGTCGISTPSNPKSASTLM